MQGTTLTFWSSEVGQASGTGKSATFTSYFTENDVPTGWTITETTYYDLALTPFGTAEQLGTYTFTAPGYETQMATVNNITGPYTLTEEITISLELTAEVGGDGSQGTIDIHTAAIPEVPTWAMMAIGLAGIGAIGGFRQRKDPRFVI